MDGMNGIEGANIITERARSRIPEGGVGGMNINDYIASLTDMAGALAMEKTPEVETPDEEQAIAEARETEKDVSRRLLKEIGMYAYLRDEEGAKTVSEAWQSLAQRRADPKIVKLWVEEEMALEPGIYDAVLDGYPELKEDLERIRNNRIDNILGKK